MIRPALAYGTWLTIQRRATARFRAALRNPRQTQQRLLRQTLERNQHTLYGRRHDFASICSLETYQERVPLCVHESLADDIDRIRRGTPNVLTAETVTRLIPTSGTTSAVKLIPFTAGLQRQFDAGIGPWIVDLFRSFPELRHGPAYWSISPAAGVPQDSDTVIPVGFDDDTAYLGRIGRWLMDATLAVPNSVRHLEHFDDWRYATLWWLLRARELRLVSVWHPSFWSLLVAALPKWWDRLTDDLARGVCRLPSGAVMPMRRGPVTDLEHATPRDWSTIWPRLTVISAWGDAGADLPLAALKDDWPHVTVQPKGILSTEAFISLPWQGRHPAAICSHVIELLGDDGACVGLHAAEIGGEYEAIVTTAGGLYRYRTGDRVVITGRLEQTPCLRLLGRNNLTSDVCGEKLHERHVRRAMEEVFRELDLAPSFSMLAASEPRPPTHYELFIAAPELRNPDLARQLRDALEARLRANPHYAGARRLGQLGPLIVRRVRSDVHSAFVARLHRNGNPIGGIKPTPLSSLCGWRPYLDEPNPANCV